MDNVATYVPTYTAEVKKDEAPFHGWKMYGNDNQEFFAQNGYRGLHNIETKFRNPKDWKTNTNRVEVDLDNLKEDGWYPLRLVAVLDLNGGRPPIAG